MIENIDKGEDMGKKKPQKTKELSVAIAEASSRGDNIIDETATHQSQPQPQPKPHTPRKRGRPRKIVNDKYTTDQTRTEIEEQASSKSELDVGDVNKQRQIFKKIKEEGSSVLVTEGDTDKKKEGQSNKEIPRRKGRRKSKPIKSSS